MKTLLALWLLQAPALLMAEATTPQKIPPSWLSNGEESWARGEKLRQQKSLTEASDAFLNGCKKQHGESCHEYAKDSERRGLLKRAARFYSYACDLKVTRSCIRAGQLWEKRGEKSLAEQALNKGCQLGDTKACITQPSGPRLDAKPLTMPAH